MKEREQLKGTSIKIPMSKYQTIKNIADREGSSVSEVILKLVDEALTERVVEQNTDIMAKIVRTQLEIVLKPHIERLAALSSKTGHMAAASTFLNTQALMDIVPPERKKDVKVMYENARKKAVTYMKTKTDEFDQDTIFENERME